MPVQLWVSVVELGCFSGLLALGYFLVLRGADLFMFTMGPLAMFAALFGSYQVTKSGWPMPIAVLVGIALAVTISGLTEVLIVRPIHKRTGGEENPSIVAVVAILFLLEQLAGTLFGRTPLPGQPFWDKQFRWGEAVVTGQTIVTVIVTLVCFAAIMVWLRHSASGRMLRAVGDNENAARTLGLPVDRIRLIAFCLAGLLAGLAGTMFAAKAGVTFTNGMQWSLVGFLAVIVGGLGSVWAPLLGAVLVATLQTFTIFQFGNAARDYVTFAVAFLFFALRPKGIFQTKVRI